MSSLLFLRDCMGLSGVRRRGYFILSLFLAMKFKGTHTWRQTFIRDFTWPLIYFPQWQLSTLRTSFTSLCSCLDYSLVCFFSPQILWSFSFVTFFSPCCTHTFSATLTLPTALSLPLPLPGTLSTPANTGEVRRLQVALCFSLPKGGAAHPSQPHAGLSQFP